jgi:hypothetical protein
MNSQVRLYAAAASSLRHCKLWVRLRAFARIARLHDDDMALPIGGEARIRLRIEAVGLVLSTQPHPRRSRPAAIFCMSQD